MLLVDYREGSHDLIKPLRRMGLEVEESHAMEFGDIMFIGRGEGGKPVSIGVEFKQVSEAVQALRTERLQGYQMRGMREMFDYSYLLLEGDVLYDKAGQLQRRAGRRRFKPLAGRMTVTELYKRTIVLHLCGGLNPWLTYTREDTLRWIEALYRVWTDKDLDRHDSHLAIYQAPPPIPISDFRMAVKAWPTIGYKTSKAVEDAFGGSLRRAMKASIQEWADIDIIDDNGRARKLGMKDATRIDTFLEGRS